MHDEFSPVAVKVWGPFACFTNPALKVERVSYPMMTPSAARGILEAIFWKPECRWRVEEIWLLKPIHYFPALTPPATPPDEPISPIRYFSLLRNEVNSRQSDRAARGWQKNGGGYQASADRAQRHTLALRDVAYLIRAHLDVRPGVDEHPAKFRDQFRRRVRKGRCFTRPYLGCREFAADFAEPDGSEAPLNHSDDLGLMLLDLDYYDKGRGTPHFWEARLENGILRVPPRPLPQEV